MIDESSSTQSEVVEYAPLNGDRHTSSTPDGTGERIDLPITEMTCAAYARRIERKLSKAEGVRAAGVNFATSRATVEYDPETTGVRQLMDVVTDVGYNTAGTASAEFIVDDSARPSGSSQPLEHHLNRVSGIVNASFKTTPIEFTPGKAGEFTFVCGMNMMRGKPITTSKSHGFAQN
jgi:copper chaperone CopZ